MAQPPPLSPMMPRRPYQVHPNERPSTRLHRFAIDPTSGGATSTNLTRLNLPPLREFEDTIILISRHNDHIRAALCPLSNLTIERTRKFGPTIQGHWNRLAPDEYVQSERINMRKYFHVGHTLALVVLSLCNLYTDIVREGLLNVPLRGAMKQCFEEVEEKRLNALKILDRIDNAACDAWSELMFIADHALRVSAQHGDYMKDIPHMNSIWAQFATNFNKMKDTFDRHLENIAQDVPAPSASITAADIFAGVPASGYPLRHLMLLFSTRFPGLTRQAAVRERYTQMVRASCILDHVNGLMRPKPEAIKGLGDGAQPQSRDSAPPPEQTREPQPPSIVPGSQNEYLTPSVQPQQSSVAQTYQQAWPPEQQILAASGLQKQGQDLQAPVQQQAPDEQDYYPPLLHNEYPQFIAPQQQLHGQRHTYGGTTLEPAGPAPVADTEIQYPQERAQQQGPFSQVHYAMQLQNQYHQSFRQPQPPPGQGYTFGGPTCQHRGPTPAAQSQLPYAQAPCQQQPAMQFMFGDAPQAPAGALPSQHVTLAQTQQQPLPFLLQSPMPYLPPYASEAPPAAAPSQHVTFPQMHQQLLHFLEVPTLPHDSSYACEDPAVVSPFPIREPFQSGRLPPSLEQMVQQQAESQSNPSLRDPFQRQRPTPLRSQAVPPQAETESNDETVQDSISSGDRLSENTVQPPELAKEKASEVSELTVAVLEVVDGDTEEEPAVSSNTVLQPLIVGDRVLPRRDKRKQEDAASADDEERPKLTRPGKIQRRLQATVADDTGED